MVFFDIFCVSTMKFFTVSDGITTVTDIAEAYLLSATSAGRLLSVRLEADFDSLADDMAAMFW